MTEKRYQAISQLWKNLPWQLILLFGAGMFFLRNLLLPMVGDDYSYAFIWDGENGGNLLDGIGPRQRIGSFADLFASQVSHYFTWGGRAPAIFCVQFFAWQEAGSRYLFDVANTLVFLLLVLLLYWISAGRVESPARGKACLFWLLFALFFVLPSYVYTMLWVTGACVYLWTAAAECAFLLPYVLAYWRIGFWREPPPWALPLMATIGLLAGWSEEAGSIVTVILTAWFLFLFHREHRLAPWMKVGMAFLMAGALLLLFAPGNLQRVELMREFAPEYTIPPEMIGSAEMFLYNFVEGFWPVFISELLLLPPILFCLWKCWEDRRLIRFVLAFATGGFLVLCAMMFSPDFRAHGGFHSVIFLLVASTASLRGVIPYMETFCRASPLRRSLTVLTVSSGFLAWILATAGCLYVENSYRLQVSERMEFIEARRNEELIVVPAISVPNHLAWILGARSITEALLVYGGDLESNPTDNRSNVFAQYHGLKAIVIDKERDWGKYGEKNEW